MSRRVALLVHPDVDEAGVMHAILSSDYVSELFSGEDSAVRAVEANAACVLWADESSVQDKCVCVVMLDAKRNATKQVRVPFSLVVEALQRLQAGHPLEPYMCTELHTT